MNQPSIASPTTPINRAHLVTGVMTLVGLVVIAAVRPDTPSFVGFIAGVVAGMVPIVSWQILVRLWLSPERPQRIKLILLVLLVKLTLLTGVTWLFFNVNLASVLNIWTLLIGMMVALPAPLVLSLLQNPDAAQVETH